MIERHAHLVQSSAAAGVACQSSDRRRQRDEPIDPRRDRGERASDERFPVASDDSLLVLDRDYLTVPENEIKAIRPLVTMVGGKVVYEAPAK